MTVTIAIPDLISPSYFPAIAAVTLGGCRKRGVDAQLELVFPVTDAVDRLAAGEFSFLAGAAHAPAYRDDPTQTPLVAALSRGTYWFLVVRRGLCDELTQLGGAGRIRIGVAPGPDAALVTILQDLGVTPGDDGVALVRVPPVPGSETSFGVSAARALAADSIDGFWANGMGAAVAAATGEANILLDARRSSDPAITSLTFPALITGAAMAADRPDIVRAVVDAVVWAQAELRHRPDRATAAVAGLFPPMEASLIADLIARDAPYYEPTINRAMVNGLRRLGERAGLPGVDRLSFAALVRDWP